MSAPSRRWMVAAVVLLAGVLLAPAFASATPPCPSILYSVSYSAPLCIVNVLPPTHGWSFVSLWWPEIWNGTWNLSSGEGFDRASDHLNHDASAVEQLTALDRDGDLNLSAGDVLTMWSPGGCGGTLPLYYGANRTSLNSLAWLLLSNGNVQACGPAPPDLVTPALEVVIVAAAFAITVVAVVLLWRRVPRD